jgi:hypothetical protein
MKRYLDEAVPLEAPFGVVLAPADVALRQEEVVDARRVQAPEHTQTHKKKQKKKHTQRHEPCRGHDTDPWLMERRAAIRE